MIITYNIRAFGKRAGIVPVQIVKLLRRPVKSLREVKSVKKSPVLALQEVHSER